MSNQIRGFSGDYKFLSNFDEHDGIKIIIYDIFNNPIECKSVEAAYQASKSIDQVEKLKIAHADTPGKSKRLGSKVKLRKEWNCEKIKIMAGLLWQKFSYKYYQDLLLSTGDAILIEENTWGDIFWGFCNGIGENWLGELLMEIRKEIRSKLSEI